MPSKACTPKPGVMCRSVTGTMRSLAWELVCIRALSLAHCSWSWCWRRFHTSSTLLCVPLELLYTDDLVLILDTQEECISKLKAWKAGMESKGLCVNMKKTKFLVSGVGQGVLKKSGKYPCAVSYSGVSNNAIQYSHCMLWVHKKCSGITKRLVANPNYVCHRCKATLGPAVAELWLKCMSTAPCYMGDTFCYLGDMLCSCGCDRTIATRCWVAWGKSGKFLPGCAPW